MLCVKSTVDVTCELCHIRCDDDCVYVVPATLRGKLIELNQRLLSDPQILVDKVRLSTSTLIAQQYCCLTGWLSVTPDCSDCYHCQTLCCSVLCDCCRDIIMFQAIGL